jgi:hypothetical protein
MYSINFVFIGYPSGRAPLAQGLVGLTPKPALPACFHQAQQIVVNLPQHYRMIHQYPYVMKS